MQHANTAIIRNMRRAIDACAELDRRGVHIRTASANVGAPLITVLEPPPDAIQTYARAISMDGPYCVATVRGVRVEWPANIGRAAA